MGKPSEFASTIDSMKNAIKQQDLQVLESELISVNLMLGLSKDYFMANAQGRLGQVLGKFLHEARGDCASQVIYLGDQDGCSRLVLQKIDGRINIELTDNSSERARQKWAELMTTQT